MAAALLALNSQRKQGGGHSNLVTCQAFLAQIVIFLGGLSWVDWSANHMVGELFMLRTGTAFTHVPYKGAGPATADLVADQIQVLFVNLPTVQPYIKPGKVRVLGIASKERSPAIPEVPTFDELGIKDANAESWSALMAPANTSPQVIKRLQDTVISIANEKPIIQQLAAQGARPLPGTAADLQKLISEDTRRWTEVIQRAKVQID